MPNSNLEPRFQVEFIRQELNKGNISYDEAKTKAEPLIKLMNERAVRVAKKYGKKHHNFSFAQLMR